MKPEEALAELSERPSCRSNLSAEGQIGIIIPDHATLAQPVEQRIRNASVVGSIPTGGSLSQSTPDWDFLLELFYGWIWIPERSQVCLCGLGIMIWDEGFANLPGKQVI